MDQSLIGPRAKISRAVQGVNHLAAELSAFASTTPYQIIIYDDLDTRHRIFQVRVLRQPPAELGVLIGEIVHNLRSALDHVACILPLKEGALRHAKPFFPIYLRRDPDPSNRQLSCFTKGHRLMGITDEAFAIVESLQPYHRTQDPERDPLAVLEALWNWDKHNALHIVGAALIPPQIQGQIVGDAVSFAEAGPVHDGKVIAKLPIEGFTVVNDNPEPMNLGFAIHPAFGPGGPAAGELIGSTLGPLCEYVAVNVMGPLERVVTEAPRRVGDT